jgi:transposase InsO family protein
VLSRLVSARGAPTFLRSDNGPEFVSKALLSWIVAQGIGTALIEPGNPWQNGVTESFNGKFRDECLKRRGFADRDATPLGYFGFCRARSVIARADDVERAARLKIQGPSGRG